MTKAKLGLLRKMFIHMILIDDTNYDTNTDSYKVHLDMELTGMNDKKLLLDFQKKFNSCSHYSCCPIRSGHK